MTAYSNMKASGVEWLGDIPEHWKLIKLRHILHSFSEKNHPELPLLSVIREEGVIIRDVEDKEANHNYIPDDLSGYKMVKKGQFVMNKMKAWQGSYGISDYTGIVSPAYFIFDVNFDNLQYFHHAIRSKVYVNFFAQASDGIRIGQWDLDMDKMKEIPFIVPPRTEQDQIVQFLDWKVSGINRLINIKKKEIARLGELKKTIVNEAVTHGINSNIPMKASGVSWVAAMPAHWEMKRIRESFSFRKGLSITKANLEARGIPVISYGQVHSKSNSGVGLCEKLLRFVNPSYLDTSANALVAKNDFIFADTSEDLAGCGNCAFIDSDKYPIFAGYHSVIAHPLLNGNIKYLAYLFQSESWRHQIREKVNAVKVYSITQKILKDIFLLLPPTDEQDQIVRFLDWKVSGINRLINIKEKEINLLKEFRSRLISDAVTGQVDVRNIVVPEYEYVEENPDADPDSDDESEDVTDEED